MGWFNKLFTAPTQSKIKMTVSNPVKSIKSFAIPVPEGYPVEALTRPTPPKKRGKSPEQYKMEYEQYLQKRRQISKATAKLDAKKAQSIGCTHFIWRTSKDASVCPECKKRQGKKYRYLGIADLPGAASCCVGEACRCWAEPILPKI